MMDTLLPDFPIDPELVAAVEDALPWQTATLIGLPQAWVGARPGRFKPNSHRRARMRDRLRETQGDQCFYCRRDFGDDDPATLDHLIPYIVVPNWDLRNLVLACEPCNQAKGSDVHAVFMPLLSALVYRLAVLNAAKAEVA